MFALLLSLSLLGAQQPARPAAATIQTAKALYLSADYEGAMRALASVGVENLDEAYLYRALCLFAMGRATDGESQLNALVTRNPTFRMSEREASPRVVTTFNGIRAKVLPAIIKDRYAAAKALYDRQEYAAAAHQFKTLSTLLNELSLANDSTTAVIADLRVPTEGYLALAESALTQARPAGATGAASATPAPANRPAAVAASRPAPASPVVVDDKAAIEAVVQRYAQAHSRLDSRAVAALTQDGNERLVQSQFSVLKSQSMDARNVNVAIDASRRSATATMILWIETVPKAGAPTKTQTLTALDLVKNAQGAWVIVERR